jgi:hypothetical protein
LTSTDIGYVLIYKRISEMSRDILFRGNFNKRKGGGDAPAL